MDDSGASTLSGLTIRLNKRLGSALKLWAPDLGERFAPI